MLTFRGTRMMRGLSGVVVLEDERGEKFDLPHLAPGPRSFSWGAYSRDCHALAESLLHATLLERRGWSASKARRVAEAFAKDFSWAVLVNLQDDRWSMTSAEVEIALGSIAGPSGEVASASA